MIVRELIAWLQICDPVLPVTIPGYEGGLDDIEGMVTVKVEESDLAYIGMMGRYEPCDAGSIDVIWLYGQHRHHSLPRDNNEFDVTEAGDILTVSMIGKDGNVVDFLSFRCSEDRYNIVDQLYSRQYTINYAKDLLCRWATMQIPPKEEEQE